MKKVILLGVLALTSNAFAASIVDLSKETHYDVRLGDGYGPQGFFGNSPVGAQCVSSNKKGDQNEIFTSVENPLKARIDSNVNGSGKIEITFYKVTGYGSIESAQINDYANGRMKTREFKEYCGSSYLSQSVGAVTGYEEISPNVPLGAAYSKTFSNLNDPEFLAAVKSYFNIVNSGSFSGIGSGITYGDAGKAATAGMKADTAEGLITYYSTYLNAEAKNPKAHGGGYRYIATPYGESPTSAQIAALVKQL